MRHVILPDHAVRDIVFYLAMEEYLARNMTYDAFFLWQAPEVVIIGRNQDLESEVNLSWCMQHGISVFRRHSGGGCVYSDMGNIMVSCITSGGDVAFVFELYLQRLALALRNLGLPVSVSGRNDILLGGRKISGNAFYRLPSRNIVHGTLLYNVSMDNLQNAITPSVLKLASKGIRSVRQRVVNLKDFIEDGGVQYRSLSGAGMPLHDTESLKEYLAGFFCDEAPECLGMEDVAEIEKIRSGYLDPEFIASGRRSRTV